MSTSGIDVTAQLGTVLTAMVTPFKPDGSWIDRVGGTWILNPGNQRGPVPTRIDLDLSDGSVAWLSQMGIEQADRTAATAPPRTLF